MTDYIKREDVIALAWDVTYKNEWHMHEHDEVVSVSDIAEIPSADVRPVVLCRDCKHSELWYGDKSRCFLWHEAGIDVFNDGFCNYGEKREES